MKRLALQGALTAKFDDGAITRRRRAGSRRAPRRASWSVTSTHSRPAAGSSSWPSGGDENLELSARNLPGVTVIRADSLNIVDVLNADTLLITQPSLSTMAEVYA